MRRLTLMLMLIGLLAVSTVEARAESYQSEVGFGLTVELEKLYGLPFNRPPYYRRGPHPPAIKEHDRYYRPGQEKIRIPFERGGYLVLPRRRAPSYHPSPMTPRRK